MEASGETWGDYTDVHSPSTTLKRYDNKGNVTVEINLDSLDNVRYTTYRYNDEGFLKETIYTDEFGEETIERYTYDEMGNCTQYTRIDSNADVIKSESVYTYDENGNMISEVLINNDGVETLQYEAEYYDAEKLKWFYDIHEGSKTFYDEAGNVIKKDYYEFEGELYWTVEYFYDEAGNCIKETGTDKDGNASGTVERTFDERGNVLKEIRKTADGNEYEIEYTYNEYGYVLTKTKTYSGEKTTTEYGYEGRRIFYMIEDKEDK